jgi:nicotinate-nucleotide adenylyltransferase
MQIGLFGGTFNPIHKGHLGAALDTQAAFRLDEVYLIPSAIPPHKTQRDLAPAEDRVVMLHLAINAYTRLQVSEVELRRRGPSYTIDTLRYFQTEYSQVKTFFLIMGIDAFLEIETWKSYRSIFTIAAVIVVSRPGIRDDWIQNPAEIGRHLDLKVAEGYHWDENRRGFLHASLLPVYPARVKTFEISSSMIRRRVRQRRSIRALVPAAVASYIKTKGLYTDDGS